MASIRTDAVQGDAPAAARSLSRLEQLEAELARAHEARTAQAAAVEQELSRLCSIYGRLKTDLQAAREERDHALAEAHEERERRTRETLRLSEDLQRARSAESTAAGGGNTADAFVQRRLPPESVERKELLPGRLPEVDGFQVIGLIGRGGMASVFRARRESDGREVALKLLMTSKGSTRSRVELFLREAAMMLQVDHPGLLRALDAGECAYGHYLVLPLIEGSSLAGRVRRKGPLREADALRIAIEVGRALRYCARGGLTHRDVKPSNLLEGAGGRILLCDFGLAALHHGDAGRPYGSPGFAAPEQILTPDDVDERADIYGLGTTLWCLVVGRRPFEGDARRAFEEARRVDLSDPRIEGADISPRLATVIRRMGRCDRTRRYRNWDEVLLDLMLVEKGDPPLAAQLSAALGTDRGTADAVNADEPRPAAAAGDPPAEASAAEQPAADSITPAVGATSSCGVPRHSPLVVILAIAATFVLGVVLVLGLAVSPTALIEKRARALAAEGRGDDAAAALRHAAELLDGAEATRILRLADELADR